MAVKVQSTIEPYNESYKVVNAKNVGVGEPGQEKPLDEVLNDLPSGGSDITVDTELSLESENPVQNKVIKVAFDSTNRNVSSIFQRQEEMGNHLDSLQNQVDNMGGGVTSWNDLTDKPFGEDVTENDLVAEQTLDFQYNNAFNAYLNNDIPAPSELVIGKEYNVVWDGVKYTVECVYNEYAEGAILGNASIMGVGDDTGEPFVTAIIASAGTFYIFTLDTSASHTVRIYTEETEIKQLDNKYLEPFESKDAEDLLPTGVGETFLSNLGVYAVSSQTTEKMFDRWHGNGDNAITGNVFVEFDGVTYECAQQRLAAMDNGMAVGNCANFGGTGNNEPFIVSITPDTDEHGVATGAYYWAIVALTDTAPTDHQYRVYQPYDEPKYLLKEDHLPFDAIAAYIDNYIDEALGGDY